MSSFNIHWKYHASHQEQAFVEFMQKNRYSDCILSADGKKIYAHKIVLASASPVFMELFQFTQFISSIVNVVNGVKYQDLRNFIDFIYSGSIRLQKSQIKDFLNICKLFRIKGIEDIEDTLLKTAMNNSILKKSPKRLVNKISMVKKNTTLKAIENSIETLTNCKQFSFARNNRRPLNFDVEAMEID